MTTTILGHGNIDRRENSTNQRAEQSVRHSLRYELSTQNEHCYDATNFSILVFMDISALLDQKTE